MQTAVGFIVQNGQEKIVVKESSFSKALRKLKKITKRIEAERAYAVAYDIHRNVVREAVVK